MKTKYDVREITDINQARVIISYLQGVLESKEQQKKFWKEEYEKLADEFNQHKYENRQT